MFTTANEMVKQKMKRNLCIVNLLEIENKIIKLEMILKYRLVTHNSQYIDKLKKINSIEIFQLSEYKLSREYEINLLIDELNESSLDTSDIQDDLDKLKKQCKEIIANIYILSNSIPIIGIITNYRISNKPLVP